jgi:AcrR family transcriptional regulator
MKTAARAYHQSLRAESTEATGRRIIEAFLVRLMEQWFDEITLDLIAEDAGVTVQTIVRRFGGKEGLLSSGVDTLGAQIEARRAAPSGNLDRLIENLIGDYEKTGDAVIRLLTLEPRHPALKTVLDFGRGGHRRWVSAAFAEVLRGLDAATRQRALDMLVIITDVYTWKLLRRDLGRSIHATAATIRDLLDGTLAEFSTTNHK